MYNKLESYATENSRHSTNWLLTYSQVLGLRLIAWIEQMCSEIIYTGTFSEKTSSVIFNFNHQVWSISKHCWSIFKSFVFPYSINLIHVHVCSTVWSLGVLAGTTHTYRLAHPKTVLYSRRKFDAENCKQ